MNITFTPEPIPELILAGGALVVLGFTSSTPLQLTLQQHTLDHYTHRCGHLGITV